MADLNTEYVLAVHGRWKDERFDSNLAGAILFGLILGLPCTILCLMFEAGVRQRDRLLEARIRAVL